MINRLALCYDLNQDVRNLPTNTIFGDTRIFDHNSCHTRLSDIKDAFNNKDTLTFYTDGSLSNLVCL